MKEQQARDRHDAQAQSIASAERAADVYRQAFSRWQQMHSSLGSIWQPVQTRGSIAIGLGIESPLEVGLRLHHTYGVPVIPGSALKGLSAFYCQRVWGTKDSAFGSHGAHYQFLFGTEDQAGMLTFDDAWIDPASLKGCLVSDVLTPHQRKYYGGSAPPSDTDDPVPISFLTVKGKFWLALRCEGADPALDARSIAGSWQTLAKQLLLEALEKEGVGGKTRSGYGRLKVSP